MSSADAAQILQLPDHATPDQVEARVRELRSKLKDKIGKARAPDLETNDRVEITRAGTQVTGKTTPKADAYGNTYLRERDAICVARKLL